MVCSGRNGREPATAQGTMVPSMGPMRGGPPQTLIALGGIGGGDAPEAFGDVSVLVLEAEAEETMGFGGDDGICEVVGVAVFLAVKIEPGVGILVNENGGESADVVELLEFKFGAVPGVPAFGGESVSFRAETQEIHHHQLAIGVPAGFKKAAFGIPAVRESEITVEHPAPIHAIADHLGEGLDFVVDKMAAAGQDAAEE